MNALKTLLNLSLVLASIFSLPAQAVPQDALGLTPEQLETLKAMARARGAEVNLLDNTGSSALMYGVRAEHPALVTSLLKAGAQPGFQNHAQGNTALHDAVLLKQPAIVLLLLREGANPHLKNWEDQSPLDYAKQRAPDIAKIIEATRL